jgi:hypothetical protein
MNSKREVVVYYYRGTQEGSPVYSRNEYPYMTRRACQQDAANDGKMAIFEKRELQIQLGGQMSLTNAERFTSALCKHLTVLFETPEYAAAKARTTPIELAKKMTDGLRTITAITAQKDGEAVKRACRELGIKHTYKAIQAFLNA